MSNISIKPDAALGDAKEIDSIVESITNNMDELNQVIKRNIPDRVRTNWSEEVRANWQRYYSDSIPMAMESMKASAVNLRTAVDEAIRYSKQ